jgi:iron complex transport system permease protein
VRWGDCLSAQGAHEAGMNARRTALAWSVLLVALLGGAAASLLVGHGDLSDPELRTTFLRLRGWRLCCSALAGAALAGAGVLVQGLFRNPLASPSILGTSAGASLGGIVVLLLWNTLLAEHLPRWLPSELVLPLGCLAGAWLALLVLLAIIGRDASTVSVLLSGFILSSLFLSIGAFLSSIAQESWALGRAVVAFTLGGVEASGARHVGLALPMVLVGSLAAWGWSRHLDVLLTGEDEARSLGVDVALARRWLIAWTALLTGAAVAIGGNVAFVGLVVPHALRPWVGVMHRRLFPAALVGGAAFVTWADVATRAIPSVGQIPLGVVTGLVGAPVFLVLLARAAREGRLA